MTKSWEEYRDELCQKLENDFGLQRFENRDYPIKALTTNSKITKDPDFNKNMKKNGQKDLATIGDAVIDVLIYEHFIDKRFPKNAKDLNALREKFGKNRALHLISKMPPVNLKDYLIQTEDDPCWEKGRTCLAVYFEALIAIIFIEHGIAEAKQFLHTISFFENVKKI